MYLDIRIRSTAFGLGAYSQGIDPQSDAVSIQIGPMLISIPAGSLKKTDEGYAFHGRIRGVRVEATISPRGNNRFTIDLEGHGDQQLASLTSPVTVLLAVGTNSGTASATVVRDRSEDSDRSEEREGRKDSREETR